jgi:hypothetical protein
MGIHSLSPFGPIFGCSMSKAPAFSIVVYSTGPGFALAASSPVAPPWRLGCGID